MDINHIEEIAIMFISFLVIYCITLFGLARHILMLSKERNKARLELDVVKEKYINLLVLLTEKFSNIDIDFKDDRIKESGLQRSNTKD